MTTKQKQTIEVNLDKLTLDDLEILDMSKVEILPGGTVRPVTSMATVLDTLDRVVIGGVRGQGFSATQLREILEQVQQAIFSNVNIVGTNGKN